MKQMHCEPCPHNTYGKNGKCHPCPAGTATATIQSTSNQCLKSCGKGEYHNGTSCLKCLHGEYQPLAQHAQTVCIKCPEGKTTLETGAESCISMYYFFIIIAF